MKIAFDLDGVLYPWHEAVYSFLKEMNKIKNTETFYEFWYNYKKYLDESEIKYLASLEHLYNRMVPNKTVINAVQKLSDKGHTIYYITKRPESCRFVTEKFIQKFFPQSNNVVIVSDNKAKEALLLEIDIFIEDQINSAEELYGICDVYIISRPWNIDYRRTLSERGIKVFDSTIECINYIIKKYKNND